MNLRLQGAVGMCFKDLNEAIRSEIESLANRILLSATDAESLFVLEEAITILEGKIPLNLLSEPMAPTAPIAPEPCSEPSRLDISANAENSTPVIELYKAIHDLELRCASASKRQAKKLKQEIESLSLALPERMIEAELALCSPEWAKQYRTQRAEWLRYRKKDRKHQKRLLEYRQQMNVHRERWQAWKQHEGKEIDDYRRSIRKKREELEALTSKQAIGLNLRRVPWRILPPGENLAVHVQLHFDEVCRRNPTKEYEAHRLTYALSLSPREVVVGEDDFDGYYIFLFPNTERVLLENCEKGNAAYVLFEDWETLSRLSKHELRSTCLGQHDRVCHTEGSDWKWRLRQLLGIRRRND